MIALDADTYRVLHYCHAWRVEVVFKTPRIHRNSRGLFTIIGRSIWYDPEKTDFFSSREEPLDLLHELSHVLDGSPPSKANEVSGPMLALDYYGSRWLRLIGRSQWMHDFLIGDSPMVRSNGYEWGQLCNADRHDLLQVSLRKAVRRGLLTPEGKPTFKEPS